MEDALEKEKRARVEQDKARRKVESDLKLAQSSVENVERAKKEIEASLQR
jgi:myosin protein heavy chain